MKNIYNKEYMPRRSTVGSACYDIFLNEDKDFREGFNLYDTGLVIEDGDIKDTQCIEVHPRSSTYLRYGLMQTNVGIIDSDYRNTIKLTLLADRDIHIPAGTRIAQFKITDYYILPNEIKPTRVRDGGLGSTGE